MPPQDLTISPPPCELLQLARARFESLTDEQRRRRLEFGLPTDRPVIMSGHQLAVWHPGILAKWLFTAATAEHGFAPAWIWVDQDANDFGELRFPVRSADETGTLPVLEARTWRFAPMLTGHLPVAAMPAFEPTPLPALNGASFATAETAAALGRIRQSLAAAYAPGGTVAEQMQRALLGLLAPNEPSPPPPPHILFATHLARTDLFAQLVARMQSDPRACSDTYNGAVAAFPDGHAAEVAMLHTGVNHPRGPELPLWRLPAATGALRERVHVADLDHASVHELAPRGLFMTGLLRLAACDLFIHGTGGGGPDGYDRITDLWFTRWLGETIAPTAVVTATLRLNFGEIAAADSAEVARSRWLAHHARHHPSLIGDPRSADRKRSIVREIATLPRHDRRRSLLFREMHALLAASRADHADRLAELHQRADAAAAQLGNAAVLAERTWPFPIYPAGDLAELRSNVQAALVPEPSATGG